MSERIRNVTLFLVVLVIADLAGAQIYDGLAPRLTPPAEPVRTASSLYHHDLRKNVDGWSQWGSYRYRFFTNDLGFRDDRVREVPLRSEATRVLLLGDSFTEGVGVSFPESFAGILARWLAPQGIEVLNAAVVSYSPTIYHRKARHLIEGLGLDVDVIIVFIDVSDVLDEAWLADSGEARVGIGRSPPRRAEPNRPPFEQLKHIGQQYSLILRTAAQMRILAQRHFGVGSIRGRLALDQEEVAWEYDRELYREYGERGLGRAAEQMDRLLDLANRHEIPLAIAVYPWPDQIFRRMRDSRQVGFWRAWARTREVTFIDLFPLFLDERDPAAAIRESYFPFDYHWNAAGHRRVAEALLEGPVRDLVAQARSRARGQQAHPVPGPFHSNPSFGGASDRYVIGDDSLGPGAGEGLQGRAPAGWVGTPEPRGVLRPDLGHDLHPTEAREIGAERVAHEADPVSRADAQLP